MSYNAWFQCINGCPGQFSLREVIYRCPSCSEPDSADPKAKQAMDAVERKAQTEANEARREAMRNLLYRKDS